MSSHTIVPLKLDFAAEKGGHGRLGRVETGLLSRTLRHRNQRSRPQHTGETRCAPLLKSKSKRLLVELANLSPRQALQKPRNSFFVAKPAELFFSASQKCNRRIEDH